MPAPNPIRAIGTVIASTGERTYRTALPNGKEIIAHVRPRLAVSLGRLTPLTRVHLELTSYDFTIGRIAGRVAEGGLPPLIPLFPAP